MLLLLKGRLLKMEQFIIAGLKTEYSVRGALLQKRSENYRAEFDSSETDIRINLTEEFLQEKHKEHPYLSYEEVEYMWVGSGFYRQLVDYDGIMLHSSCVEKDGFAYLFSARSGTGKSTHTHLWLKNLPGSRIVNDDKPALLLENGTWYACGTPFSGKTDENLNVKVPVRAIIFIKRAEKNRVEKLSVQEAIKLLFEQTVRVTEKDRAGRMLDLVSSLLTNVPVFSLECNMEDEAAIDSYTGIERILKNED